MPNAKKDQEIYAKISDSRKRDAGRGFARLDPLLQKKFDLHSGDGIEIVNPTTKKRTAALVMHGYSDDADLGIIRIDSSLRLNLMAHIDDKVSIRKIEVHPAQTIQFAPLDRPINVRSAKFLANVLENRVVMQGNLIKFDLMSGPVYFVVKGFTPKKDVVQINKNTQFEILKIPVDSKELERTIPRTTYEDLGGLADVIQKSER